MIKAYWIFKGSVGMSLPKMMIQACHGTDLIHLNQKNIPEYEAWVSADRIKVFLVTETEENFEKARLSLLEKEIKFFEIIDIGLTEFDRPTCTGLVIAPFNGEQLPGVIRFMPRLKNKDLLQGE